MLSKYIREQKRYSFDSLCQIFECNTEKVVKIIKKLKEYGILKTVRSTVEEKDSTELQDFDILISEVDERDKDCLYVFTFVGIIVVYGFVLKCYPKYIFKKNTPKDELSQILKVLDKYNNSKEQIIKIQFDNEESQYNLLAVMLYLLKDYFENGIYNTSQIIIENNGLGEIIWDKTINETFTFIMENKPYYFELQTKKQINDDADYFKKLHEFVLTKISNELETADLLDLFQLTGVNLSDEEIDVFGETEYILYQIEKELSIQYNTRKQILLKTLYIYISKGGKLLDSEYLSVFGTNKFENVWETVCAQILNNQLEKSLKNINGIKIDESKWNKNIQLREIIEKPFWSFTSCRANKSLIPDLITIYKEDEKLYFLIFDAKYYTPILTANIPPKNQPGIESITKQYLYQLAYQNFIKIFKIDKVINCFLMPTEEMEVIEKGFVRMDMLKKIELQDIQVRLMPAQIAYTYYLASRLFPIRDIKIFG